MGDKRELLRHIIEMTGIDPARSVMIGDREHDIVGAKANGIFASASPTDSARAKNW